MLSAFLKWALRVFLVVIEHTSQCFQEIRDTFPVRYLTQWVLGQRTLSLWANNSHQTERLSPQSVLWSWVVLSTCVITSKGRNVNVASCCSLKTFLSPQTGWGSFSIYFIYFWREIGSYYVGPGWHRAPYVYPTLNYRDPPNLSAGIKSMHQHTWSEAVFLW